MTKTQYIVIASIAGIFLLAIVAVAGIVALPAIFGVRATPVAAVTETPQVIIITATDSPTQQPTGAPTETPTETQNPTETTAPTATVTPTNTQNPIPCEWAEFVKDIAINDGAKFVPGAGFTKTWRLKNIGSCTWDSSYSVVFVSGSSMDAKTTIPLSGTVRPGETVDISVAMEAPEDEGKYTGYWMLRGPSGFRFGVGDDRSGAFWVSIVVELPCLWASFVTDVTIPDDTSFSPGVSFVKTWRLRNIGSCDWTTAFDVVRSSGTDLGPDVIDMPERVEPGETVDISVTLTSPSQAGDYRAYWMLEDDDGKLFGINDAQSGAFWVDIVVVETINDYRYDFAANYCAASWKSGVGLLPCPGKEKESGGFVIRLNKPALENKNENEPALWVQPDADPDGWISGKYPAIVVKDGDHFMAWVGCLNGAEECEVTFYLRYQIGNGDVKTLGTWDEVYDGEVTMIDIDLSDLAGETVSFILIAEVDGGDPDDAAAFWFSPRIE